MRVLALDPEVRFLLRLLLPRRPGDPRPEPPDRGFSWEGLESRGVALGLGPLLHQGLREWEFDATVPPAILNHLAEIRRMTAVRNAVLLHHLGKIEATAAEMGLAFVVLKGGDLVQTVYPDRSLRVLLDLDLLLRKPDADRLESRLPELGYATNVSMENDWFEENLHHGLPWRTADGAVTLEVHWSLTRPNDPFRLPVEDLLAASEPLRGGSTARRLAPSDSLEFLAVHVFRHLTTPDGAVRSVVDFLRVLEGADGRRVDRDLLWKRAAARGTTVPLALLFAVAKELRPEDGPGNERGDVPRDAAALFEAMFAMPVRQPPAIVSGFTGLGQAAGVAGKLRFLLNGLYPKSRDLNRDLSAADARRPLLLRRAALVTGYVRELIRIGPGAALGAYRLGRLRRKLAAELSRRSSGATPRDPGDRGRPPIPPE